ncbi:hypothetical protein BDV38DRAFT_107216 [Aspergillus pseudotamarii]|uniref:Uncharacterized protein n=1 Tax=Aspergillus pseudotamarii TaxID=132259 RepID=A0A5N6SSB6_ASPPS|nr:uncharacterized protein BDV38DRAFT_107216 [Aspergillus pseudotamarii]KAE8136681.1 hypothetical protein BDV38DRAFT_107216 [Aspergillus pseudotamarii]
MQTANTLSLDTWFQEPEQLVPVFYQKISATPYSIIFFRHFWFFCPFSLLVPPVLHATTPSRFPANKSIRQGRIAEFRPISGPGG